MTSQTPDKAITYRRMTEGDLASAHEMSQAVGWPHRLEDWHFVHRLGTGFIAELDGAVIGTAMCWKQGHKHGSLGMIIVSSEHQGKGIGRRLMALILVELGDRCTLLNATEAGKPLYESLGFRTTGAICQHQGIMLAKPPAILAEPELIRAIRTDDLPSIIALANCATGTSRNSAMKQLAAEAEGVVLERNGEINGFSIIRRFGRGYVIGPVVAPDSSRANALIACWSEAYADQFVRVDIVAGTRLSDSLMAMGLVRVDGVVSMARNGVPLEDAGIKQFAILNQALS
jgi:GNAT superfamily N-acetyltransferase